MQLDVNSLYNTHLSEWTVNDVSIWLSHIQNGSYSHYTDNFEQHKIDGLSLQYLTENDLNELGIKIMGDRKHIIVHLNHLFKQYNLNQTVNGTQSTINEQQNIAIDIDSNQTENTNQLMIPSSSNSATNKSESSSSNQPTLFHPDYLLPMIELSQFENQTSHISDNILRAEYDCPWNIEPFNEQFNRSISELFLSSSDLSVSSTFEHSIDAENNQLILHGNFIELSGFMKDIYELYKCPTLNLLPRISHFLMDCGELPRIAKMFNVLPFIRNDGKLAFYDSSNSAIYNAQKAMDAVLSLLKTLDCSSEFGSPHTAIIGTLLSMDATKQLFTAKLARFGHIQYWHRGHSIFEENIKNIQKNKAYHLLLMKAFSPSGTAKMIDIIKDLQAKVRLFMFAITLT